MSGPIKRIEQTPESYAPKTKPEIITLAEKALTLNVSGEKIPFLFKKEIIHLSKALLVGKSVTYPKAKQGVPEEDGGNPPLNLLWQKCGKDGAFDYLERQTESIYLEAHLGMYYNLSNNDGNFSYIVGVLMKEGAPVPEGFASHEIPDSDVAVCWYRYKDEDDIWAVAHGTVEKYMAEQGYAGLPQGQGWCSELYPFGDGDYKAETGYNLLGYLIAGQKKEDGK